MSGLGTPRWTDEQRAVLESDGQGLAVMAGAGAGKTTVLVEKCSRLLARDPDARICAVSFTEKSASDLRLKLSQFDLSRHWVTTIHGLCGLLIREFPESAGVQGDERILSESEAQRLWNESIETLWFDSRGADEPENMALQRLLAREGRTGLSGLLQRCRDLEISGLFKSDRFGRSQGDLSDLLLTARRVLRAYSDLKGSMGVMDFSDLEKFAIQVMRDESARRVLRSRFSLILIDEFQDTNAVQAEILWSLAREDRSNLCVVGDPKQSIYRFRDADVSLFEELCTDLPLNLSLSTNFRSQPQILNFVNELCSPVFQASELKYLPLNPGREASVSEPVSRIDILQAEELAGHLINSHRAGVAWEKMAILMRKIRGNEHWIQALSRHGIPVAVGGGGLFWSDPRVLEAVALLAWWAFPADEMAALEFLRSPWVGVSDEQIDRWMRFENRDLMQFWKTDLPVAVALAPFRRPGQPVIRPAELLRALLAEPTLNSALAEMRPSLLALIHRLEEFSLQGMDFLEVVTELRALIDLGKREKEIPPPRDQGVLSILTIHASKGLEFDHVYLIDFGKKPRAQRLPLLFWDRHQGAFLTGRDEFGDKSEKDPLFLKWKSYEQSASLCESKRQLYVALTRAREKLIVVCEALDEGAVEADSERAVLQDHWRAWLEHFGGKIARVKPSPLVEEIKGLQCSETPLPQVALPDVVLPEKWKHPGLERARHAVTEWTLLSRCPRAYVRTVLQSIDEPDSDEPTEAEERVGPSAVDLGKSVHQLLERWARFPSQRATVRDAFYALEAEVGADRLNVDLILEWLQSTSWLEGVGLCEWSFEWKVGGVSLVGAVDRLVEVGENLVVIDYKVFSSLKDPEVVRQLYSAQLELYAGAVSEALGLEKGVQALVVQIAPEGVQEVWVDLPLDGMSRRALELATRARALLESPEQGESHPNPQASCVYCPHRWTCPESKGFRQKPGSSSKS
jgi:ATP-dependent helicase/nuclease subunit A